MFIVSRAVTAPLISNSTETDISRIRLQKQATATQAAVSGDSTSKLGLCATAVYTERSASMLLPADPTLH